MKPELVSKLRTRYDALDRLACDHAAADNEKAVARRCMYEMTLRYPELFDAETGSASIEIKPSVTSGMTKITQGKNSGITVPSKSHPSSVMLLAERAFNMSNSDRDLIRDYFHGY